MTLAGKSLLLTGANLGIGQVLAAEALARGAERVYARHAQAAGPPGSSRTLSAGPF